MVLMNTVFPCLSAASIPGKTGRGRGCSEIVRKQGWYKPERLEIPLSVLQTAREKGRLHGGHAGMGILKL